MGLGAIGEAGVRVINESVVREAELSEQDLAAAEAEQQVQRRSERLRRGHDRISLAGRPAVIIDDGIAIGATAKAACRVARAQGASRVVLAVPTGPDDTVERFAGYANEVVCPETPEFFFAVGQGYRNFSQTSDEEVTALLDRAREGIGEPVASAVADPPRNEEVRVTVGPVDVVGNLTIPQQATGIVRGATHLFDEPGTLERVAELARGWLIGHLSSVASSS